MAFIRNSTISKSTSRKVGLPDFFSPIMSTHYFLYKTDWCRSGVRRDRTTKYLSLFGINGNNYPNDNCSIHLKSNEKDESFLRVIISEVSDHCVRLSRLIPPFENNFYAMTAFTLESKATPFLKSLGIYFIGLMFFRIQRLTPQQLALICYAMTLLSTTGKIDSIVARIYQSQGHELQNQQLDDDDVIGSLYNFPSVEMEPGKMIRQCAALKKKKKIPIDLSDTQIQSILNMKLGPITGVELETVAYYYWELKLPFLLLPERSIKQSPVHDSFADDVVKQFTPFLEEPATESVASNETNFNQPDTTHEMFPVAEINTSQEIPNNVLDTPEENCKKEKFPEVKISAVQSEPASKMATRKNRRSSYLTPSQTAKKLRQQ